MGTEKPSAGGNSPESFDALQDTAEVIAVDSIGATLRAWAENFPPDWARIVASYITGTPAVKLARQVKDLANKRYVRLKGTAVEGSLNYLVQICDANSVVLGLNIHLLIHVIVVNQATLEAVSPDDVCLQQRFF